MQDYYEQDQFPIHDFETDQLFDSLDHINVSVPDSGLVLDVGGGRGQHASRIAGNGRRVYVIDVIPYHSLHGGAYAKTLCELHAKYERPFPIERLHFLEMDAQNLLFKDALFDFIYSINTFEHIPNPFRALDEIMRVLKPGGVFYIQFDPIWTSPFGHHLPDRLKEPWSHLVYDQAEVHRRILENGGTEADIRVFETEMNRKRLSDYFALFSAAKQRYAFDAVTFSWWPSSQESEPFCEHPNFEAALAAGYKAEELFVRGFRFCGRLSANQ